jgi:hypothetical protein
MSELHLPIALPFTDQGAVNSDRERFGLLPSGRRRRCNGPVERRLIHADVRDCIRYRYDQLLLEIVWMGRNDCV